MWKNKVIVALTISDGLVITGWGLVMPIIAVFIADNIPVGMPSLLDILTKTMKVPSGVSTEH